MDFVGPRQRFSAAWHYLIIIDHASRFVSCVASPNQSATVVIQAFRHKWIPYFGVPKTLLCDNQSIFKSEEFTQFVGQEMYSHLVYSSPYYPLGNSINEASHKSIEHGLRARLLQDPLVPFPDALSAVTTAYNSAYQSAIKCSPFEFLFGKMMSIPGLQDLSFVVDEPLRIEARNIARAVQQLTPHLPPPSSASPSDSIGVGDNVIFPRSDYEQTMGSPSELPDSYSTSWSLPCRVTSLHEGHVIVTEFATSRVRRVPRAVLRVLPADVPPSLAQLNWEHICHSLPRRWGVTFDESLLPSQYSQKVSVVKRKTVPTTSSTVKVFDPATKWKVIARLLLPFGLLLFLIHLLGV